MANRLMVFLRVLVSLAEIEKRSAENGKQFSCFPFCQLLVFGGQSRSVSAIDRLPDKINAVEGANGAGSWWFDFPAGEPGVTALVPARPPRTAPYS